MTTESTNPLPLSAEAIAKIQAVRKGYGLPPIAVEELGHFDIRDKSTDVVPLFNDKKERESHITLHDDELRIKAGDIIRLIAGYDSNMVFTVRVLGFCTDGIYIQWESYWAPVRREKLLDVVERVDPTIIDN